MDIIGFRVSVKAPYFITWHEHRLRVGVDGRVRNIPPIQYKIRLMEKDREIADFTAKMKKVEFKHNREVKEASIAKERAETLLKDEKGRLDKQTKAAQQHAQQNQVL